MREKAAPPATVAAETDHQASPRRRQGTPPLPSHAAPLGLSQRPTQTRRRGAPLRRVPPGQVLAVRRAAAAAGLRLVGGLGLLVRLGGVLELLEADDADAGAEAAVAAVLLDVTSPRRAAARAVAVVAAPAAPAAASVPAASAASRRAPPAAAAATAATAVVVADARVDDRLDVADGGRGQADPGGECRVARLVALGLLGAHRGPLHRLAVVAPLGLQGLEHGLMAADPLDGRDEARLGARGAGGGGGRRLRGRGLRLLRLIALGHRGG